MGNLDSAPELRVYVDRKAVALAAAGFGLGCLVTWSLLPGASHRQASTASARRRSSHYSESEPGTPRNEVDPEASEGLQLWLVVNKAQLGGVRSPALDMTASLLRAPGAQRPLDQHLVHCVPAPAPQPAGWKTERALPLCGWRAGRQRRRCG